MDENFLNLPFEILDYILQNRDLSYIDICRLSQTCTKLRSVCKTNELWKIKLQQRWPKLLLRYSRNKSYDWLKEFQSCLLISQDVRKAVSKLSPIYYKMEEVSSEAFNDITYIIEKNTAAEIVINELNEIIHNCERFKNLTNKYYATKALRHVLHQHLTPKWKDLKDSSETYSLEYGAVLLSQWCQPSENVTHNGISDELDVIARHVIHRLPTELSSKYTSGVPSLSLGQEKVVLETMNSVIYGTLHFRGNQEDYYNENNSYIDKVLSRKLGIPISMSVIYVSVASRLGVICECVNYPSHFLIKWKEHPLASVEKQYSFIDPFHSGKFLNENEVDKNPEITQAVKHIEVYKRMLRNLINIGRQQGQMRNDLLCLRNALELYLLLQPDDLDLQFLLIRICLHLKINLHEVKDRLQDIADADQSRMGLVAYLMSDVQNQILEYEEDLRKKVKTKLRAENKTVTFSVGMVMKHKRYNYMCVIYGWDSVCKASQEWIHQMGVHTLPKKDKQPFYNVLVEDGSNRYAAEENLFHPQSYYEIPHPEVGKYFQEFTGRYYVMNNEKMKEYPNDPEVTCSTVEAL